MTRPAAMWTFVMLSSLLLLGGCAGGSRFSDGMSSGYRTLQREECVPYARRVSGINIRGDAWTWWQQADGQYRRGQMPLPGAVLVLSKSHKLRHGHLAVVTDILSSRDITVTHANWGDDPISRRLVYESMRAQDVSSMNDWSSVRFWNREAGVFGFPYPAYGFIYNTR